MNLASSCVYVQYTPIDYKQVLLQYLMNIPCPHPDGHLVTDMVPLLHATSSVPLSYRDLSPFGTACRRLLHSSPSMAVGAPRARFFTASWPPFNGNFVDGESTTSKELPRLITDPYCKVTVRALPRGSLQQTPLNLGVAREQEDTFPSVANIAAIADINGGAGSEDRGVGVDDPIFVESSLLMRNYNSISLSSDGTYSLTLSECHGFMADTTATNNLNGEGFEGEAYADASLLFLPLPHSIVFDVDNKIPNGRGVIGNFHLLPIAHATSTRPTASLSSSPTTEIFDALHFRPSVTSQPSVSVANDTPQSSVIRRTTTPARPTVIFGSGFMAGTVAGFVACHLLMRVRVSRWRESGLWGKCREELRGTNETKEKSIGGRCSDCTKSGAPRQLVDKDTSDDDSEDSDGILNGNVPDPVGLPRNEEDWRALFDTLYQDEKEQTTTTEAMVPAGSTSNSSPETPDTSTNDDR